MLRNGNLLHSGSCYLFNISCFSFCRILPLRGSLSPALRAPPFFKGGRDLSLFQYFAALHYFLRRTFLVEPSEPVEPAPPLSQTIKGQLVLRANPEPILRSLGFTRDDKTGKSASTAPSLLPRHLVQRNAIDRRMVA